MKDVPRRGSPRGAVKERSCSKKLSRAQKQKSAKDLTRMFQSNHEGKQMSELETDTGSEPVQPPLSDRENSIPEQTRASENPQIVQPSTCYILKVPDEVLSRILSMAFLNDGNPDPARLPPPHI
jgi:hypothetical protein